MSLKCTMVLLCGVCLSFKVVMTSYKVVCVSRNERDSFRVGKEGCTNNVNICSSSSATCQDNGFCLCKANTPTLSVNKSLTNGNAFGCVQNNKFLKGDDCMFYLGPFKAIPCSDDKQAKFDKMGPSEHTFSRCDLLNTVVKFPDNTNEKNKLNESCIDLKISNGSLHFKWKNPVPGLRGTIITFNLSCSESSGSYKLTCLRAKVSGTWKAPNGCANVKSSLTVQPSSRLFSPTLMAATSSSYLQQPMTTRSLGSLSAAVGSTEIGSLQITSRNMKTTSSVTIQSKTLTVSETEETVYSTTTSPSQITPKAPSSLSAPRKTITSEETNSTAHSTNSSLSKTKPTVASCAPRNTTATKNPKPSSNSSDCSFTYKIFIAPFALSFVLNITLGVLVGFQRREIQRYRDKNPRSTEMQNIDEEGRTNRGDIISTYQTAVRDSGIQNYGLYTVPLSSSEHNIDRRSISDHDYEEPSNYEPLRRNHAESDAHKYQSLVTSQIGK